MNKPKTIVLRGKIYSLHSPLIMAIINVTPDSFFEGSRTLAASDILSRAEKAIAEGAHLLDIGAYSTRPNADFVTPEEEWQRMESALKIIRRAYPNIPLSIDTFRASVAERAVKEFGVDMINDISGGSLDSDMFPTVAQLNVPYVLMHTRGTPRTMVQMTDYDHIVADILKYFAEKIEHLRTLGFSSDIVLDLGYCFAKTTEQNYTLLASQSIFETFGLPILTGVSRKSMINKVLQITPQEALNGTTVLNTIALLNGANILRVHDVKAAVETVKIVDFYRRNADI